MSLRSAQWRYRRYVSVRKRVRVSGMYAAQAAFYTANVVTGVATDIRGASRQALQRM